MGVFSDVVQLRRKVQHFDQRQQGHDRREAASQVGVDPIGTVPQVLVDAQRSQEAPAAWGREGEGSGVRERPSTRAQELATDLETLVQSKSCH